MVDHRAQLDADDVFMRQDGLVLTQHGRVIAIENDRNERILATDLGTGVVFEGEGAVWAESSVAQLALWIDIDGTPLLINPATLGRTWAPQVLSTFFP